MTLKTTGDKGIQTLSIHAGENPDVVTGASTPAMVMSSTFVVDEEISFSANNLTTETPFVYTRWDNPTTRQLEQKLVVHWNRPKPVLPSLLAWRPVPLSCLPI